MDLELLAADAARASRVYLSDRARSERWGCRRCWPSEWELLQRLGRGLGLLLLNLPQRLQDLLDARLDFRRCRRRLKPLVVDPILLLDELDTARDTLVTPEVFPAGEDVVGCPGHVELRVGLTCVDKVVYSAQIGSIFTACE